jgi:hypothetical protein
MGLSVGAIGLSLLLPCNAAAPVKIATVAPITDVAGQIDASVKLLEGYLASDDEYKANKKKVRTEATVVSVLSQAVVESDDKASVPWHAAAADVRNAAISIADSKTYDEAKKGLAALKEAHGGKKGAAASEHEWNKLAKLGSIMDAIQSRSGKIRGGSRKKADTITAAEIADGAGAATVLAVLALAVHEDTHEVKKKEETADWQKAAKEFQTQMTATAAAFKKKDMAAAADGWKKGNTACNSCHDKFREKE